MRAWLGVVMVVALGCEEPSSAPVVVASVAVSAPPAPAPAKPERAAPVGPRIAVTIDDLPWIGAVHPGESQLDATDRLLARLTERQVQATAFVVCGHATGDGEAIVRRWIERGMPLANHTQWHRAIDDVTPQKWARDLSACHDRLGAWEALGDPHHFRFPYLQRGATEERRAAARAALGGLDYVVAPITVNVFDWHFATGYGLAAKRKQPARRSEIARAYVDFAVTAARRARATAQRKLGRDVAHILLLHANLLAADHLGLLLDALKGDGFVFVPLEEALRDAVYRLGDAYEGREGVSWLYRIAPVDEDDLVWARTQSSRLSGRYAR